MYLSEHLSIYIISLYVHIYLYIHIYIYIYTYPSLISKSTGPYALHLHVSTQDKQALSPTEFCEPEPRPIRV